MFSSSSACLPLGLLSPILAVPDSRDSLTVFHLDPQCQARRNSISHVAEPTVQPRTKGRCRSHRCSIADPFPDPVDLITGGLLPVSRIVALFVGYEQTQISPQRCPAANTHTRAVTATVRRRVCEVVIPLAPHLLQTLHRVRWGRRVC